MESRSSSELDELIFYVIPVLAERHQANLELIKFKRRKNDDRF